MKEDNPGPNYFKGVNRSGGQRDILL